MRLYKIQDDKINYKEIKKGKKTSKRQVKYQAEFDGYYENVHHGVLETRYGWVINLA